MEKLIFIQGCAKSMIFGLAYFLILSTVLNLNLRHKILLFAILPIFAMLNQLKTIVAVLFLFIYLLLISYKKWAKDSESFFKEISSIFWATLCYLGIYLLTNVTMQLFFTGFDFELSFLTTVYFTAIYLFLFSELSNKFFIKYILNELDSKMIAIQMFILLLVIAFINEVMDMYHSDEEITTFIILFALLQFGWSIYFSYLYLRKNNEQAEINNLEEQLKLMRLYTEKIEQSNSLMKKFKHDYHNLLLGLKTEDNKINQNYLDKLSQFTEAAFEKSNNTFVELIKIKNPVLKSFFITKILEAKKANLNIKFEILKDVEDLHVNEVTLIRALGILIDNAIEAAKESQKKFIFMSIANFDSNLEIDIENTYPLNLDIDHIINSKTSSKGSERGLGLKSLDDLLNENPEFRLERFIENNKFTSVLTVLGDEK